MRIIASGSVETTTDERLAMFELIDKAKLALDAELHPTAYNIGVNDGAAAASHRRFKLHFRKTPR